MYTQYKKEDRYCITYVSKLDGQTKKCWPKSKEKKDEQLAICKEKGIRVLKVDKLYPFSTYKNQHNFELIHNIAMIALYEMERGERPFDQKEYDRMDSLRERSERYFGASLPVAWVPWNEWKDMKELSEMAILHRQDACIEAGRPDLVAYC